MLPFLQPKKMGAMIMAKRVNNKTEDIAEEGAPHPQLLKHTEDLISGIHAKDATAVATALESINEHFSGAKSLDSDNGESGAT